MSSLIGVFDPQGNLPADHELQEALALMAHRGAESLEILREPPLVLAHAVFDPSDDRRHPGRAADPETGAQLLLDGLLDTIDLRDRAETADLIRRLETDPNGALQGLDGDFALVHWSPRQSRLLLARDHTGTRPMLVARSGSRVIFGSTPRAIIALGHPAAPDPEALGLVLQIATMPAPWSGWAGITRLHPGERLLVTPEGSDTARFWRYRLAAEDDLPEAEHVSRLRRALEEAVAQRVAGCRDPVFCMSGGIDSTAITAVARRLLGRRLRTVCLGFPDTHGDDRPFARRAAQALDTEHQEVLVTPAMIDAQLEDMVTALEVPSILSFTEFFLSRALHRDARLLVTGEMADSQFGGTSPFLALSWLEQYQLVPRCLRQPAAFLLRSILADNLRLFGKHPVRVLSYIDDLDRRTAVERYLRVRGALSESEARMILKGECGGADIEGYLTTILEPYLDSPMNAMLAGHIHHEAPNEYLTDQYKLAAPLVYRSPYTSLRVIAAAAATPVSSKVKRGVRKHVLIEAVRDVLPPEAITRPKMGFGLPMARWLAGPLRHRLEEHLSPDKIPGFLDPQVVVDIRDTFLGSPQTISPRPVWLLLTIALWADKHFKSSEGNSAC